MKKLFIFLIISTSLFANCKNEQIVCVHGFLGSPLWMGFIEKNLKKEGFQIINWKYKSREDFIEEHGKKLAEELKILVKKNPKKPINFVTHSMGGLVLLSALNNKICPMEAKIGKIILITPPLKGSVWARFLRKILFAKWILKEFSGEELSTKKDFQYLGKFPQTLKDILVIEGTFGFNPILFEKNDGTLMSCETNLEIPHKRISVKRGHKTIVFSKKVAHIITSFFKGF